MVSIRPHVKQLMINNAAGPGGHTLNIQDLFTCYTSCQTLI